MRNFTSGWAVARSSERRSTCCEASPSPVSPTTTNAKSFPVPAGDTAKSAGRPAARSPSAVAEVIAARHTSVRSSAHESQTPDAQFSVSKYQLMPQTGIVAAKTAATGRPTRRLREAAATNE